MELYLKNRLIKDVKNLVKKDKVICALSGGVDSSVVALLVNRAVKKFDLYYGRYWLMRKNEFKYTYKKFKKNKLNVHLIDASSMFLAKLKNIKNPEKKGKL